MARFKSENESKFFDEIAIMSEKEFFANIATVSNRERKEMAKSEQDPIAEIPVSPNRDARLTGLLDSFKTEIDYNLISCTSDQQQRNLLKRLLLKAEKYKETWHKQLSDYQNQSDTPFWKISSTNQQLTVIGRLIQYLKSKELEMSANLTLKSIFKDEKAYQLCIDLMEDLEITNGGQPTMTKKSLYKLTALITAIKETPGILKLDNPSNIGLLQYFNAHLNTEYKSFGKRGPRYDESLDDARKYLKGFKR